MKQRKNIWMLTAIIVAATATWYVFHPILRNPSHIVHELGGDGIKNYFSYIYHSLYGNGWWFDGMNYPYGEHIMFVDGQPILTITLSWLRNWCQFTPESLNVILNLLMTGAFFLAIVYVCKIIAKLGVSRFWAIMFAPLIVTLSVQNFRVFGLYGLSYACIVPMVFYWFMQYYEGAKRKYILYLFVLSAVVMFLHPYQYALVLIWSVLYIVGYLLLAKEANRKQKWHHVFPVLLMLICSFALLKSALIITDPMTDRPEYPHGLLSYGTTGIDIFTNEFSPYWNWLREKGITKDTRYGNNGSYAYTGIVSILTICLTIGAILLLLLTKRREQAGRVFRVVHPLWWFIAAEALLFSMGVPFVWGMEWAFHHIGALRQFRTLSWFALLFYYVITAISVVLIFRGASYLSGTKKWLRQILIIIPFSIWCYESYTLATHLQKKAWEGYYGFDFFNSRLERNWNTFFDEHNLSPGDFQAILYVPYFHVGSEKIWLSHSGWGFCVSLKAAYQLELPMADANMSRSSWSQTFKQVKVGAGPYAYKSLFHEAKDKRPFLLMHMEGEELTPDERYLFQFADSIGVNSNLVTYALYPQKLAELEKKEWERIKTIHVNSGEPYYYESFEESRDRYAIFGRGAQAAVTGKDTIIATIDARNWPADKLYEASAWFLVNDLDYRTPSLMLKCMDTANVQLTRVDLHCGEAKDTRGMWFRPNRYFKLPDGTAQITVNMHVTDDVVWHRLDEVMIRAADDTVIMKDNGGRIMVNNHLLPE